MYTATPTDDPAPPGYRKTSSAAAAVFPTGDDRRRSTGTIRGRFRRFLAWSGVAVTLIAGAGVALVVDTSHGTPSASTVDERAVSYVGEQLRAQGAPDSAFAVVRDGRVIDSATIGDGVTVDTPFLLGSLSKSFTALAVMQLVDEGVVGLDDPVTRYIRWFRTANPSAVITVRQLLDQTSGLPTWAGTVDLTRPDTTLEHRVRQVADVEPVTTPGAAFHYCNTNYATLGLLVEKVTGMRYADYLRQQILDPLDMHRTFTNYADARRAGLVNGSAILLGVHISRTPIDFPGALPDGTLVSTVGDLAHYIQAQRDGTFSGRRIISERSLLLMHTGVARDDQGSGYAFGWRDARVNGQRVIQHEGDLSNFHSDLGMLTGADRALVVLTANNDQTFDVSAPYTGGLQILSGSPIPDIDNSYLIGQAATSAAAIITLLLLAGGTVGLVRRVRRVRTTNRSWIRFVGIPALAYWAASIGLVALVYFGLQAALHDVVVVSPALLFASLPGVSTIVTFAAGWFTLAGVTMLVVGIPRRRREGLTGWTEVHVVHPPRSGAS